MSYNIKIEPKSGYLLLNITGDNSPENVRGYLSEVSQLCLQHSCPDVLIVENLTGPGLNTFTIYSLISQISNETRIANRIAYVDINPEHNSSAMQFAEDVAVNRGIRIKLFETVQDAELWMVNNPHVV